MRISGTVGILRSILLTAVGGILWGQTGTSPIQIAVTVEDIQAIVKAVGGSDVDTFPLFKGCLVRPGLAVEKVAVGRLANVEAVVWTGFFGESSAINEAVRTLPEGSISRRPHWIDVSPKSHRVNLPDTGCYGVTDTRFMYGDPFFWLNPDNGARIASNVAEGLRKLRPNKAALFQERAAAFSKSLKTHIAKWRSEMAGLKGLRVFGTQCGWQNISAALPGPVFGACKSTPGQLPPREVLVGYVKQLKAEVVLVDPNTPPDHAAALREMSEVCVMTVPSSIEFLSEKTYFAVFENLVTSLKEATHKRPGK